LDGEGWRRGAVLVPIFARAPHGVVFVERAAHLRRHPGQIGFPGGAEDPLDAGDPVETALRESFEELGVGADRITIVARLPELEQHVSRFRIVPVVGIVGEVPSFTLDLEEIAAVFTVPLAAIVASGAIYEDTDATLARSRAMYAFDYEGRHVWGFTARILKSFVDAWDAPESELQQKIGALIETR
jgi:8-oxo-dGTP pyrophosphatase MutT (NUDIX family)